jgi:hypothetical protein
MTDWVGHSGRSEKSNWKLDALNKSSASVRFFAALGMTSTGKLPEAGKEKGRSPKRASSLENRLFKSSD